jgi:large subunit ribosomal protein L9
MEVILREHVDNLGKRGEIVKVADGYARNYLLPRKLALPATEGNKKHVERERKKMEAREADEKGQAEALAARLSSVEISIARRVGETDALYGSVTSADVADFLKTKGFEIDRRKLILPEPIKAVGEHTVPLKLHREVTVPLKVAVVKEGAKEGAKDGGATSEPQAGA